MRLKVLIRKPDSSTVLFMTRRPFTNSRSISAARAVLVLLPFTIAPRTDVADPRPAAVSAFNSYINAVESRLSQQHRSPNAFLALLASVPKSEMRLRRGELIVEQLTPSTGSDLPGAMLHHWRGTAFVPGATAADFERLMKDFNAYPQRFSPQVLQAKVLAHQDDRLHAVMRVRQEHILTVVMDTTYDIVFAQLDAQHRYSISRSTQISEIDSPGTAAEHALDSTHEHGFLWRLNTYWSYEERAGGLYMQIESVSLTRSIPRGLGWAVGPFVESVPRESLQFTLRSVCNALRR
jgi:ribosome-associated toxin RatA of RatAB toxin-antitoxin module